MMTWTDDPIADFLRHDREMSKIASKIPDCDCCGESLMGDDYYYDVDGEVLCEECMEKKYRKDTDDLI